MMPTPDDVEQYLRDFNTKLSVYDMIIIERDKNKATLALLEILHPKPFYIAEFKKLSYKNYYKGPTTDTEYQGEYWEFGTTISDNQIYIKINYGLPQKPCIMISFHQAQYKMIFPLS